MCVASRQRGRRDSGLGALISARHRAAAATSLASVECGARITSRITSTLRESIIMALARTIHTSQTVTRLLPVLLVLVRARCACACALHKKQSSRAVRRNVSAAHAYLSPRRAVIAPEDHHAAAFVAGSEQLACGIPFDSRNQVRCCTSAHVHTQSNGSESSAITEIYSSTSTFRNLLFGRTLHLGKVPAEVG